MLFKASTTAIKRGLFSASAFIVKASSALSWLKWIENTNTNEEIKTVYSIARIYK